MLLEHKKYCNGVNRRQTRIVMPEEGKNILLFSNCHKQMKKPYVIYADFESKVIKIPGCKHGPEWESKSYTEKAAMHEACGYSYIVVRCDSEIVGPNCYRGENAVEKFFVPIMQEEVKIRESMDEKKSIVMTLKDWRSFRNAADCHICNKSLIQDKFLDSLPVWNVEKVGEESSKESREKWSNWGQGHRKCFYEAQKKKEKIWGVQRLKINR